MIGSFESSVGSRSSAGQLPQILEHNDKVYAKIVDPIKPPSSDSVRVKNYKSVLSMAKVIEALGEPNSADDIELQKMLIERYRIRFEDSSKQLRDWIDPYKGSEFHDVLERRLGNQKHINFLQARESAQSSFITLTSAFSNVLRLTDAEEHVNLPSMLDTHKTLAGQPISELMTTFINALKDEGRILDSSTVKKIPKPKLSYYDKSTQREALPYQILAEKVSSRLIGNEKAILDVSAAVRSYIDRKSTSADPVKPLVIFLAGPTGTGKTEIVKAISEALGVGFKRFDMGEFGSEHTVSNLVGSPVGYIGSENRGQLPLALEEMPKNKPGIILFDEVEKAHQSIWRGMLAFFDEGRVSDSHGEVQIKGKTVLFMTSNEGAKDYVSHSEEILNDRIDPRDILQQSEYFAPEFKGRVTFASAMLPVTGRNYIKLVEMQVQRAGETIGVAPLMTKQTLDDLVNEFQGAYDKRGTRGLKQELDQIMNVLHLTTPRTNDAMLLRVDENEGYKLEPINAELQRNVIKSGKGDLKATFSLAKSFEAGSGVDQDLNTARYLYEKCAVGGMLDAQRRLAEGYRNGSLGYVDDASAKTWDTHVHAHSIRQSESAGAPQNSDAGPSTCRPGELDDLIQLSGDPAELDNLSQAPLSESGCKIVPMRYATENDCVKFVEEARDLNGNMSNHAVDLLDDDLGRAELLYDRSNQNKYAITRFAEAVSPAFKISRINKGTNEYKAGLEAYSAVALAYIRGTGVPRMPYRGVYRLHRAYRYNRLTKEARVELARCYAEGICVEKDLNKARSILMEPATRFKNPAADVYLASLENLE